MKYFAALLVLTFLCATGSVRADSTVVFNEIMFHPQTNEAQLEWIELYNQMAVDMDISGWYLTNGISYKFAEGTVIQGGGFLVVALSPADLVAATGATNVLGPFSGRLANGSETLELRNNNNRLMDSVTYGVDGDWPLAPDGSGVSLAKLNPNAGSAEPKNWGISARVGGTPGLANFPVSRATTTSRVIVPIDQTWNYDQSGTNDWSSSSAWLQPNFPEPGWLSGQGLLAYETCGCLPEPIRTQLRTNTSVATFYFRSTFNFTNDPQQVTLSLKHVIDDGMILYLNGVEVWRIGMPAGPVTSSTFANRGITDGAYEGPFTIPASSLIQGTNVLAAEVHQNSATSSDITFGLSIEQLTTIPGGQTEGGGAAPVSFNEVAASTNSAFWLELINYGTTNVSLEGYTLARFGGVYREYVLPAQTLAPGEFLQLTKATLGFAANSGDMLVLYGPGKTSVADAVIAKRKARARFPDGTGAWLFPDQPTVGASNSFAFHKEIVINEIMYDHRGIPASPTIFSTNFMVPITNLWKYNQQGADLGSTWRNAGYNDSTWGSGRALLYNTASILPAPKNTQLALTNPTGGRLVTWYFRSEFVFNGGLGGLQLNLRPIVDDGAVFYLNGVEIYRLNMPDGPIAYTNLASASVATAAYTGPFAVPTNSLVLGTNVLAVEVHQFTTSALGADVVFGAELFGTALTSPPLPYHDSPESWIELYNRGNNAVNLTGWQLSGGIKYSFPTNKTLAAGAYLVIASDVAYLQSLYPGLDIAGPFGGNLSHQSDDILLTDAEGNPANEVKYYSGGRWPQNAHAGGSSLELRDPRSDNSKAEAWADSDEAGKAQWNSYSYRGTATAETAASPSLWKEFVLGMLEAGEVLLDDISVIDLSNSTQLIQNGSFETGLNAWRIVGNHKGRVEVDPDNSANHVLHLTATGPTDHMHNHAETTLAGGVSIVNGRDYQISFRAKWLAGSRDLHTRLYFNRLPKVTTLQVPALNGTPGVRNSRYLANAGPTYSGFRHAPAVPNPNQAVTVSVAAQDPDGIATMTLWWALDGGSWNQVPMTQGNGLFRGTIPGNPAGTLVQFYVQGTDPLGASSTFPAAGINSRALLKVNDSQAIFDRLHTIRMLMTTADASLMHAATNVMSNDILSTTVVYDEQQVFYDVGLHLQGSERGRNDSSRVGFTLQFNPDDLFRGVHGSITMDRSGGYAGKGGKHDEIVLKHLINHAGGMPGMYDDLCHVLAPRSQENGTGLLILAKYGDVFLDSQYVNGGNGNLFKLELIYSPTSTSDGTVQGLKLPQPDDVVGTDFQDLGNNKESYRWNFLNENNHTVDDYSQLMNVAKTFSFSGAALDAMSQQTLDVNEWMRVFAFQSIGGVGDTYGTGGGLPHNFMTYIRPVDLKAMAFPWDMDFGYYLSTSAALLPASNVGKIAALPANQRLFYGHLLDMLTTTCNTAYVSKWANHYGSLVGQNWSGITTYFTDRANFILSQLPTTTPFAITSNNGNDFGTNNNLVVLSGTAPIQVKTIEINGIAYPVTWTSVTTWTLRVPVGAGNNLLTLHGIDNSGHTNAVGTITVTNSTPVPQPRDFVVINEIMYHSVVPKGGFVEIYNTHSNVTFDLSNWRLDGAGFVFPEGSIILPGAFLVVASDVNVFAQTYGNSIPLAGQYDGNLQNSGESLKLVRPGTTNTLDEIIDEVHYSDKAPWPTNADGNGPSLQLIDASQDNYRAPNWMASGYTPGASNSVRGIIAPFPLVWINEVLPLNTNGIVDNFGQHEPWMELFNNGPTPVNLAGMFLTDNYSNLTQWPFPAGASINPGQFLVIWADGESAQTTATDWHTSFRLANTAGSVALVRTNSGRAEVMDYVNYFGLDANHGYGSGPDGQPQARQFLYYPTPGASNNLASPPLPVVINEWMADNAPGGFADPADGQFQDWFELYNPNTNIVNLSGYYLTDTLAEPLKWHIPENTIIAAHGFLLVWADNTPAQNGINGDLHAGFQLSATGEAIGLFSPDGIAQSTVTFGPQFQNVSQGYFPDGNTNSLVFMTNFTPRASNRLQAQPAAHIQSITVTPGGNISIAFTITQGANYRIEYKNDLIVPNWTPLGATQTALTLSVTAQDNVGLNHQRFYRVVIVN